MLQVQAAHVLLQGIIAGLIMHVVCKFFSYQLFGFQKNWPGEFVPAAVPPDVCPLLCFVTDTDRTM